MAAHLVGKGRIALHLITHLDQGRDLQSSLDHHQGGIEGQIAGAQNQDLSARKGIIAFDQGMEPIGPHNAGLVPALEG